MKSHIQHHIHRDTVEEEVSLKKLILSRHSLYSLIIFLAFSIWAYMFKDFHLVSEVPEYLNTLLGTPPPAYLVSISLVLYFFASLILTFTAITKNIEPIDKWDHLGYRVAFFIFYSFSGAIAPNFLPVFLVGLVLYSLDQYHIWVYNAILFIFFIHPTHICLPYLHYIH